MLLAKVIVILNLNWAFEIFHSLLDDTGVTVTAVVRKQMEFIERDVILISFLARMNGFLIDSELRSCTFRPQRSITLTRKYLIRVLLINSPRHVDRKLP
ncbi:hypothetical protein NPIL_466011 [Nephila pilipes]|uniref:Secreted protein n=1 Tax=Nephila pilipes TaxID=299642 RepID=A0A8X6PKR0_NEPPI|nr:hypothetical protein NPIL_466011 [Nephila pilipes]